MLILGIGVAGLQAIATARRLGAQVQAYDVRSETREQAESLGAKFLELKSVADASGTGGYARELTAEERAAQQAELNGYIGDMDVVITTAQVPGRRPPVLVTADGRRADEARLGDRGHGRERARRQRRAVAARRDDRDGQRRDHHRADQHPGHDARRREPRSTPATSRALLTHFVKDGAMNSTSAMRSRRATVITYRGEVVHAPTAKLLGPVEPAARPGARARSASAAVEAPAPEPVAEPEPVGRREPAVEAARSRRCLPRRRRPSSPRRPPRPRTPPRRRSPLTPPRPRRPSRPMDSEGPVHRQPHERRCRVSAELLNSIAIFVLAILVGIEVISKVPATLHTPLMSGANSIHGIVLVGAMIIAAEADNPLSYVLAFVAIVFGAANVVGGYVVTDRMLQMFKKKPTAAKADAAKGA